LPDARQPPIGAARPGWLGDSAEHLRIARLGDMLALLRLLRDRARSDFLMESRLGLYRQLLETALDAGYRIHSAGGLWRRITDGGPEPGQRYLVLRHDVDTDWRTAAAMWEIDQSLGIECSYFFRLSTTAPALMARIADAGSEASYHYEELATVAKRRGLSSGPDALAHLTEARDLFAANIGRLRAVTGLPMHVVAAHGDFVNRRLGVPNWRILDDPDVRRQVGVELETYDEAYLRHLRSQHSDAPYPRFWAPDDPAREIQAGQPVVAVLVHPRHWRVDRQVNARDDVRRVVEGLRFEVAVRRGQRE
jgi:hypothetical protein